MIDKEHLYANRINEVLVKIQEEVHGRIIPPHLIRELELACFDFSKTIPKIGKWPILQWNWCTKCIN